VFLADVRFCQVEHEHSPPLSHPAAARIIIWTIRGFCAAESDQQQNSWKQVLYFPVCFGLLVFTLTCLLVVLGQAPNFLQSTHLEDIKAAVINIHIISILHYAQYCHRFSSAFN
jgi:thiosulfate reductase cytochrome b subunit